MRMRALLGLIGGLLLLFVLLGCENDESNGQRTNVTGTVTGLPAGDSVITLTQDGRVVRSFTATGPTATLNFANIQPGTYFVVVSQPDGSVRTIAGPVVVAAGQQTVNIQVEAFTPTTLPSGVTVPTNGTATLAVLATDAQGNPVNATVTVDALPSATGNPAVVTGIPTPGPHAVTITVDGTTNELGSIVFDPNTVTVVRISAQLIVPVQEFAITGIVRNAATDAVVPTATVSVIGQTGAADATDASGVYTIANIAANTTATAYTLRVTDTLLPTFAGPVVGTTGTQTLPDLLTGTAADLGALGVTVPTDGTATVIVNAVQRIDGNTVQIGSTVVIGAQSFPEGNPAIATGVTAVGTPVTVQVNTAEGNVAVPNVTLAANAVTVVTAFIPTATP